MPLLARSRRLPSSSQRAEGKSSAQCPLTVALVVTSRVWGGAEQQAALLARGLRRRGHSCHILAPRGSPFAVRMAPEGFLVETFSGTGRNPVSMWHIRRYLRRIRADVLHMNDPHALTSAGLASLGLGTAARIASRHCCFPIHFATRYTHLCDRLICVIGAVADICQGHGIPREMMRIVHCGSDEGVVRSGSRRRGRRSLGLADDQPLLLTVALLNHCKGHAFLLDALPGIVREHPRVCVALAGDGETAGELKGQTRRLGIDSHVRFLGYRNDVPDLLKAADLFVMPSLSEGFCSVLIEAMLAGLPIVTTTVGGIPDVVGCNDPTTDRVAWTVPPGDSKALCAAILESLRSPEVRAERGARGEQRALARFTADTMVEKTLEVYRESIPADAAA